jgi:hypothetical protein
MKRKNKTLKAGITIFTILILISVNAMITSATTVKRKNITENNPPKIGHYTLTRIPFTSKIILTVEVLDDLGDRVVLNIDWDNDGDMDETTSYKTICYKSVEFKIPHDFQENGHYVFTFFPYDEFGAEGQNRTLEVNINKIKSVSFPNLLSRLPILKLLF